jgi:hypothetical protein
MRAEDHSRQPTTDKMSGITVCHVHALLLQKMSAEGIFGVASFRLRRLQVAYAGLAGQAR